MNDPVLIRDGGFIRDGLDAELDDLRRIADPGKQRSPSSKSASGRAPASARKAHTARSDYIEVSCSNLHAVPADYQRKQTIAGGERYITPALKGTRRKCSAPTRGFSSARPSFRGPRGRVAIEAPSDPAHRAGPGNARRARGTRETATICNYIKAHVHDGDEFCHGRPSSSRGTARPWPLPNDITLDGVGQPARHP